MNKRECVECGEAIDLDDETSFITIMHHSRHRYVCSRKCMLNFYQGSVERAGPVK